MVIAVVGAGGKTTKIRELCREYREMGKRVLVTTTTHMYKEDGALLTDDPEQIKEALYQKGYAFAGRADQKDERKICGLSPETYESVCQAAEVVLVEADGAAHLPVKYPREWEPVIPAGTDQILIMIGMSALGKTCREAAHHPELVSEVLGITVDTELTAAHLQTLLWRGYLEPLRSRYPKTKIQILASQVEENPYCIKVAHMLEAEEDVSTLLVHFAGKLDN